MKPKIFVDHLTACDSTKGNRQALFSDVKCGCISCLKTFSARKIKNWTDNEQTALCPKCGMDSVITSEQGYALTPEFLSLCHWVAYQISTCEINCDQLIDLQQSDLDTIYSKYESGDPQSALLLGKMYYCGRPVKPDLEVAEYYLRYASKKEVVGADILLLDLLTDCESEGAEIQLIKIAESGNIDAQLRAGYLYINGDIEKAVYWFERAARSGSGAAADRLAILYENGLPEIAEPQNFEIDLDRAKYWAEVAREIYEKEL